MGKHVIYNRPNMDADVAVSGNKIVKPPKLAFKVEIELDDKVLKLVQKDSILLKEMNEAVTKIYDQTCSSIQSKLSAFEKLGQVMVDKGASQAELDKQLDGVNKSIEEDKKVAIAASRSAVEAVWKKYQTKKKEYLKYGIKIAATITGTIAGLAVSIGMLAASGFTGGASGAFAIIGLFKSCVTLASEITKAAMEIEKARAILDKQLKVVEAMAKSKAGLKANELTAVVIKQFLGESQPSIKQVGDQFDIVEKKLDGIEIKAHDASVTLNKILDKQEEMKDDFMKQAKDRLSKHPGAKAKEDMSRIQSALDGVMLKSRQEVMEQVGTVNKIHDRWKSNKAAVDKARPRVEALKKIRGVEAKILENVLVLVDIPLGALDGNGIATAATELGKGCGSAAGSLAYDKVKSLALDKTLLA
ncbi:MAG: hypothetical protein HBSAPP03_16720 [Phycisphaerae bacterium]|nr:MAG: hypothetical protein HBSAPP03_16720 [Phycisphaerae bacterium]